MAFALNRSSKNPGHATGQHEAGNPVKARSPLAGLLGGRNGASDDSALPEVDIAAGLSRALRNGKTEAPAHSNEPEENPVRDALTAIEAALYAIDRVRDVLEQACEVTISAKDVEEIGGRALLAESYDELRLSINEALEKIDPRAATLIGKNQHHIDVMLGGRTKYSVSPIRLDVSEHGLDLAPPVDAFATYDEIDNVLSQLDKALGRADSAAASYCRDAQYLIARMKAEITAPG